MVIYTCEIPPNHKSADTTALIQKLYGMCFPSEAPTEVIRTQSGKPELSGSAYHVGVTHCENRIFIAFCTQQVGIDAEKKTRIPKYPQKIAEKYFSQSEKEYCTKNGVSDLESFMETWVKKEAAVKLSGAGLCEMSSTDTLSSSLYFTKVQYKNCIVYVCTKSQADTIKLIEL